MYFLSLTVDSFNNNWQDVATRVIGVLANSKAVAAADNSFLFLVSIKQRTQIPAIFLCLQHARDCQSSATRLLHYATRVSILHSHDDKAATQHGCSCRKGSPSTQATFWQVSSILDLGKALRSVGKE